MGKRQVKFNLAIAGYRPGQIVNYDDLPVGQQFWIDNKDILGTQRICEFLPGESIAETNIAETNQAKINALFKEDDPKIETELKPEINIKDEAILKKSGKKGKRGRPRKNK